jgi:hypothetical protein
LVRRVKPPSIPTISTSCRYCGRSCCACGVGSQKAHAADVPLIVMPVPERSQAALFSLKNPPGGLDAFAFERKIAQIAAAEDIYLIDVFSDFSREPNPEKMFYVVNTHLSPGGNVVITRALTRGLLKIPIPGLSNCGAK